MKEMEKKTSAKGDQKIVDLLESCGCNGYEARCLCYLLETPTAMAKDIERRMDMRQPEVSIGLRDLQKRGIIETERMPLKGKGRPKIKYTITQKDAIYKQLRGALATTIQDAKDNKVELNILFS